jgi:hypothetical protein
LAIVGVSLRRAEAASQEVSHQVTVVVVKPALSFSQEADEIALVFEAGEPNSESRPQTVLYRLNRNTADDRTANILTISVKDPPQEIELQSDLSPTIDLDAQHLANVTAPSPSRSLPITWKAVSKKPLASDSYPVAVLITLKES